MTDKGSNIDKFFSDWFKKHEQGSGKDAKWDSIEKILNKEIPIGTKLPKSFPHKLFWGISSVAVIVSVSSLILLQNNKEKTAVVTTEELNNTEIEISYEMNDQDYKTKESAETSDQIIKRSGNSQSVKKDELNISIGEDHDQKNDPVSARIEEKPDKNTVTTSLIFPSKDKNIVQEQKKLRDAYPKGEKVNATISSTDKNVLTDEIKDSENNLENELYEDLAEEVVTDNTNEALANDQIINKENLDPSTEKLNTTQQDGDKLINEDDINNDPEMNLEDVSQKDSEINSNTIIIHEKDDFESLSQESVLDDKKESVINYNTPTSEVFQDSKDNNVTVIKDSTELNVVESVINKSDEKFSAGRHINVYVGGNLSKGISDNTNVKYKGSGINPLLGFSYSTPLGEKLDLEFGMQYDRRGGNSIRDYSTRTTFFLMKETTVTIAERKVIEYLKFPVLIQYELTSDLKIEAGLHASYLLNTVSELTESYSSGTFTSIDSIGKFKGYMNGISEYNIGVMLGASYQIYPRISLGARFTQSINNITLQGGFRNSLRFKKLEIFVKTQLF